MTQEQILEGNKLIAEFMDVRRLNKFSFNGEDLPETFIEYDGTGCDGGNYDMKSTFKHTELEYHTSWDWLMPVVEKIERLDLDDKWCFMVEIGTTYTKIDKWDFKTLTNTKLHVCNIVTVTDHDEPLERIETAWMAVVEFIKWYNSK